MRSSSVKGADGLSFADVVGIVVHEVTSFNTCSYIFVSSGERALGRAGRQLSSGLAKGFSMRPSAAQTGRFRLVTSEVVMGIASDDEP